MASRERFLTSAPQWLLQRMRQVRWIHKTQWQRPSSEKGKSDPEADVPYGPLAPAEGLASQQTHAADYHVVMFDIDIRAALIPSSTEGHSHLYFDKAVKWEDYLRLLDAMNRCGLIEDGFFQMSKARGAAYLRLPWIQKHAEQDRERSLSELDSWLLEYGEVPRPTIPEAMSVLDPKLRGKDGTDKPPILGIDVPSERDATLAAIERDATPQVTECSACGHTPHGAVCPSSLGCACRHNLMDNRPWPDAF